MPSPDAQRFFQFAKLLIHEKFFLIKAKCGVELIPLKDILFSKKNNLYLRKLHCVKNEDFYKKLNKAHSIVHNRPYDLIITDWVKSYLGIKIGNERRKKPFWCSALVSFLYYSLGFLDKNITWTTISPKQLGTEDPNKTLKFINCTLDKEVQIN